MSNVFRESLSIANLEALRDFLIKHELPNLIELYGFLVAVISGPNLIMPSRWMDFLGLDASGFDSMDEAQSIMGTIMALYNDIAGQLQENDFHVINPASMPEDPEAVIKTKQLWAKGYMSGVALDLDAWLTADDMLKLLLPMKSLVSSDEDLQELIDDNGMNFTLDQVRQYGLDKLSEATNVIYQYWLERRYPSAGAHHHSQTQTVKVARNNPCPCGSGKKHKKCCLH